MTGITHDIVTWPGPEPEPVRSEIYHYLFTGPVLVGVHESLGSRPRQKERVLVHYGSCRVIFYGHLQSPESKRNWWEASTSFTTVTAVRMQIDERGIDVRPTVGAIRIQILDLHPREPPPNPPFIDSEKKKIAMLIFDVGSIFEPYFAHFQLWALCCKI